MGFSYYRNGLKSARAFFERDPSELSSGESWDEPVKSAGAPLYAKHTRVIFGTQLNSRKGFFASYHIPGKLRAHLSSLLLEKLRLTKPSCH